MLNLEWINIMLYSEYVSALCKRYPDKNLNQVAEYCSKPEFLRTVAIILFLDNDLDSELAIVTRDKLNRLLKTGVILFHE